MQQLLHDIELNKKIKSSSVNFIKHYNLQTTTDLPILCGSFFLIKNNTIIEFSSLPVIERWHPMAEITNSWRTNIIMHNICYSDICKFSDSSIFDEDMESNKVEKTTKFLSVLLQVGFKIYIKHF